MRLASPEAAERELAGFWPHLLVHNDTAPIPAEALEEVPCRVEVLYSDSMSARTIVDGTAEEADDMGAEGLMRAVDRAVALTGQEPAERPG